MNRLVATQLINTAREGKRVMVLSGTHQRARHAFTEIEDLASDALSTSSTSTTPKPTSSSHTACTPTSTHSSPQPAAKSSARDTVNICPVCALTGHIIELQVVRVMPGGALTPSVDWYCRDCRTTGHNPALGR